MPDIDKTLEAISADPVIKAMIPVVSLLLNIACPAVPAVVWTAILTALLSGDLTPEHIEAFMKEHDIKTYSEAEDFPANARNGGETP